MENLLKDLRYALRTLRQRPGFTVVAVLSLALGIGLNTTIFSVVNAILIKQLAVADPDSLVEIYSSASDELPYLTSSYPDYLELRNEVNALEDVAVHAMVRGILTYDGRSELAVGETVSENYFDLLGVTPALGRDFLPEENETEGTHPVVVLSHGLWQRRFGAAKDVLGETLRLSGIDYTIVGVAPTGFHGTIPGFQPEFWAPTMMVAKLNFSGIQSVTASPRGASRVESRGTRWLFVNGRLAPGATIEDCQAQVSTVMARLTQEFPDTNDKVKGSVLAGSGVRFHPMIDDILAQAGLVLLAAVGLVLVVACANVANMLLARAHSRGREIAMRLAIGANRGRLLRQLLTESLLLASMGGVVGVALAYGAARLMSGISAPLPIPLVFTYEIDATVLIYASLVSLATAVAFGIVPALRASSPNLVLALKGDEDSFAKKERRISFKNALVVVQLAGSLVLLVAGALLTRGLVEAQRADLGFEPSRIASLSFNLGMNGYSVEQAQPMKRQLLERLAALPGVEGVSVATRLPLAPDINMEGVAIPGLHENDDEEVPIDSVYVGSDYFKVVGIPILRGRAFNAGDRKGSPGVVIINETMAELYWPDHSPLGETIRTDGLDGPSFEVVGVSRNHKVRSVGEDLRPYLHFASEQFPSASATMLVRTRGPAALSLPTFQSAVLDAEPEIVFTETGTASEVVELTLTPTRLGARLLGAFGALALLLAAVGLYGVIAYSVSRRTREVGIRMALGAGATDVLRLILGQGMGLAAVGILLGSLTAGAVARILQALLFGVSAVDPLAYGGAALLLLVVALAANALPAWRASRLHPISALRHD